MKIGLITDSIRDQSTGIGYYAKDVITELMKMDKKNEYFFIDFLQTEFNSQKLIKLKNPFKYFKTYLWHNHIPFKAQKVDIDLILNFSACPHFFPFKQKEIFFVYDISWYLYPEYHPKSRVLFYKYFFKQCLKNSNKIVVDSLSTKNDLINYFNIPKEKMFVIYPPFKDTTKDIKTIPYIIDSPYILFIGTMEPRKNIGSIIKAYKRLKDAKDIKQKLVLCGKKGWMYDDIFKLIKALHLEASIIYLGYITNEEKKYLYKHADFFVFPSFYEGFGIPVLEAMSYGCPVITSNLSSLPEAVGAAGLQVSPDNLNELTNKMDLLIQDKKMREKFKKEGFIQAKKISNVNQIKALIKSF